MIAFSWLIVLILASIAYLTFKRWRKYRNMPPGPKPLPVLGNLLLFRGENRPAQDIFNYLSYEYGPYMTVWLTGWKPAVILSSYEAIREAVIENLYDFASRPESPIFDFVLNGSLGIAFAPSNETWAAHKKMAGKAIRQIVDGKKLEEQTAAAVAIAANEMMKNGLKNPMPIAPYVKNTVYNVIFMFALGKMFELNDPEFQHLVALSTELNSSFGEAAMLDFIPGVGRLLPMLKKLPPLKKFYETIEEYLKFSREQIRQHKVSFDDEEIRDVLDAMIAEQKRLAGDASVKLTDDQLAPIIIDIFTAGVDTTSNVLQWLLLLLALNPELQERCCKEIRNAIGDRPPTLADRSKVPLMEATILETLRLYPPAPIGIPHTNVRPAKLANYEIPENSLIFLNIYGMHTNSKYYKDPLEFNPELHFMDENGLAKPKEFMPFSAGRRVCLGEQLAKNDLL